MVNDHHMPTPYCFAGQCFHLIKQTQTEMPMITSRANLPTVLLDNGFMVHNQTNMNRNNNDHLTC